jgi:NAD(P)-dependent dehydrogenase (short-subunit alcohol dehydrogenase family)
MARPRLAGKSALVTGGTRGIGLAIVQAFVDEGARVAFSGTTPQNVASTEARFGDRARCLGLVAELSAPDAGPRLFERAEEQLGSVDVVVNNAGVASGSDVWAVTPDEWDRIVNINLRAVFLLSQAAARSMRGHGGSIINVSSIAGQNGGIAGSPAYAAAKAGVIGLTRSLARRFAADGIRVNCIAPADIETDMTAGWPAPLRERLVGLTPLRRFGRPDEVSGAAVFLASDDSSFVTGQTLSINGGAYMG